MINAELANRVSSDCQKKIDYFQTDRDRFIEHASLYWGVDNSQWPPEIVSKLHSEGRQAPQMNIMANKLDGLRSTLIRNQFDMKFTPVEGDADELTLALQDMYYSDKDMMGWDYTYDQFLRDFLIQYGVERLEVNQSKSKIGNIAFCYRNPIQVFPDPGWMTPFIKDLREVDEVAYYTPDEIAQIWPDSKAELEEAKFLQYYGRQLEAANRSPEKAYGERQIGIPYQDLNQKWGSKQKVVEHHEMRDVTRVWQYNLRDGFTPFPDSGYEPDSTEDIAEKKEYILRMGLSPFDIRGIKESRKVYYVTTVCSAYNIVLANDKSPIQIGMLPYLITGPTKFGTQFRGIADLLKDVQYNTNKYVLMMQEILNKSARNGFFIDPEMFGNDAMKMREAESAWNRSDARIWTKPGAGMQGMERFLKEIPPGHIPQDLFAFNNLMEGFGDKFSYQPAASEGRSESSKESGKLFQSKYEAAVIARGVIDKMLELHQFQKAEMYLELAKTLYTGVPRAFSRRGTGEIFRINEDDGRGNIRRDMSSLQRHRIIITPSQKGIDVRINRRGLFAELKQSTRDPLMGAVYDKQVLDTFEMNDDSRAEVDASVALVIREAALSKVLNIKNMEAQLMQLGMAEAAAQQQIEMAKTQAGAEGIINGKGQPRPQITQGGRRPTMKAVTEGSPVQAEFSEEELTQRV